MTPEDAYPTAFKVGAVIQLVLLPILTLSVVWAMFFSMLNMLAALFFYPFLVIWVSERSWSPVDPVLGPHQ